MDTIVIASVGRGVDAAIQQEVLVNRKWKLTMEVDSGASVSLLPSHVYLGWDKETRPVLEQSRTKLSTYTGGEIKVLGKVTVLDAKACTGRKQ